MIEAGVQKKGINMGFFGDMFNTALGIGGNLFSGAINQGYAQENMRYQNELNKDYSKWNYLNQPSLYRQGLEKANFNPILAANAGQLQGGSSTALSSSGVDLSNAMTNAYKVLNMERKKNNADIENVLAGANASNASASLMQQQADTELYKQKLMESETMLTNIQQQIAKYDADLKKKDLDYYDKRWILEQRERLANIRTMYINAQANHVTSEARMLDAHTAQANYNLQKGITDYENIERKALADFYRKHPEYVTIDKYGNFTSRTLKDLGIGVGSAFAGIKGFGNKTYKDSGIRRYEQQHPKGLIRY